MEQEERIDLFLNHIDSKSDFYLPAILRDLFGQSYLGSNDYHVDRELIFEEDLIRPLKLGSDVHCISPLGKRIIKSGGWIVHQKNIESELDFQIKRERIEVELAESNLRANEQNRKDSKRNHFFLVANFIFGILNIAALFKTVIVSLWEKYILPLF